MKKYLFLFASALLLLHIVAGLQAQVVGEKAPEFTYSDPEGNSYSLSDFKGKVVFLFVFGNSCRYCKEIGNDTETKVQQVYGSRDDFQALGIDTWNSTYTAASIGEFLQFTGITYPVLVQAKSFEQLYSTSYDRVMVIDREGILRHKDNGKNVQNDLDNAIAVIEGLLLAMGTGDPEGGPVVGLNGVFPNPAVDRLRIRFATDAAQRVRIRVFNNVGQELRGVLDANLPAGEHTGEYSVSGYPSGIYYIRMETGGRTWTRKIQVAR
jgi:peroxiredoxin